MSTFRKKLLTYLPIIIGLFIVCFSVDAYAGIIDAAFDAAVDAASLVAAEALGLDTADNCVPPQAHSSCLFCPLFKVLFMAGNYVAERAYSVFSTDLGKLIAIFLAVSLALIVLKNVATMSSKDPGTVINDIFQKAFVCIVIFLIVTRDYYHILNITIVPVIQTGLSFTNMVDSSSFCPEAGGLGGFSSVAGSGESAGLPSSIGTMILCAARNIEEKINLLFENGRWAFCLGTGPHRILHIIPHPIYIIDGLFLYLGGIFFIVAYPWVLGDAIIQLGISMALLPFAVAGYAFNGTKSYLPKVFSWMLHSIFVFIFMTVLVTCIITYITNLLSASTAVADPKTLFTDPNSGVAFFGPNMMMLIFVLVIGWSYMPTTKDLAEKFSEGAGLSAAQKFGTELTSAMEKQVGKVADKATDIAIDKSKGLVSSGALRARALGRRSMISMTNVLGTANATGGKTLKIGGITYSTQKDASGHSVLKREWTNPVNGRKHEMYSDKYTTIRQEKDKHGNLIKSKVEFKKDFVKKHLFNADGTINMGSYNKLMSTAMAQDPEMKKALMASIAEQRLKMLGKDINNHYTSRTITVDPSNPNKLIIEQTDNKGKTTVFNMEINATTGQIAVGYRRKRDRNHIEEAAHAVNVGRKTIGRTAKIWGADKLIKTLSFGGDTVNLGIIKYEVKTDASGNKYYERTTRSLKPRNFWKKNTKTYEVDGSTYTKRTTAGATSYKNNIDNTYSEEYEVFFDNGVVSTTTTGYRDPNTGDTQGEVTVFKYSKAAQQNHDSIKAQFDDNQVVDSSGRVSSQLGATLASDPTQPNPLNLTFGMSEINGYTHVNGIPMQDFYLNNIFAEGRRHRTNKFATDFGRYLL